MNLSNDLFDLIIFGGAIFLLLLSVAALVSLAMLHKDLSRIANEIKFLNRRSEILDVNDTLRHVPRDLKSDYFNGDKDSDNM